MGGGGHENLVSGRRYLTIEEEKRAGGTQRKREE